VKTRTANEWRDFWAERGERELRGLMGDLAARIHDWFEHA
jgi:hypothetical protein